MQVGKTSRLYKISYILFAVAAVCGLLCAVIYTQMTRHMKEICEYKGRATANNIVSEAIDEQVKKDGGDYLKITRDDEGKIISLSVDTKQINAIENDIKTAVNNALGEIDDNEMGVPVGTLTGVTVLSGRGAEVKIKLHQVGAVDAYMISKFEEAGINQTKHTLKIKIKTELSAILPLHSTDVVCEDEYLIGETIIVGEVPNGVFNSLGEMKGNGKNG